MINETAYEVIEDIKCYAPTLAFEGSDYPSGRFEILYELQPKSFWFKSRSRVIEYLFEKYLGTVNSCTVLEIGCGTGFVLQGLSKFKNLKLYGAELEMNAIKFAKRNLSNVEFFQLDARKLPFSEYFNAIATFDLLEHIEEDTLVMENIYKSLKTGGYFFISVPQHKWLWSKVDEVGCHKRRYTLDELTSKLRKARFSVVHVNSFLFTLLPLMLLSRLLTRITGKLLPKIKSVEQEHDELIVNPLVNNVLDIFMSLDELLTKCNIKMPVGGSLIVVAKKD